MTVDVKKFRNLFQDILKNYPTRQTELDTNTAKGDDADKFSAERDNLLQFKLQGRDSFYIKKVKEALQRIHEGEFGLCQECGEEISEARLNARPVATKCLHCKEEQERNEGHVLYHKRSHTHGKSLVTDIKNIPMKNEEILKENVFKLKNDRANAELSAL